MSWRCSPTRCGPSRAPDALGPRPITSMPTDSGSCHGDSNPLLALHPLPAALLPHTCRALFQRHTCRCSIHASLISCCMPVTQVHQRVPLFVGSKAEVEYLESFF